MSMLALRLKIIVTLNLFQGPSILSRSATAARWMLKRVQHDEVGSGQ